MPSTGIEPDLAAIERPSSPTSGLVARLRRPRPPRALGRAAQASALRPSAQGAPRRANAIGLKPQARPSPTARCADRQAMRRAASPYKPGESQRQAMQALRKGRKGRSAQATQNPGPDDQSARQVQQTAARRSASACACARGFVGEKACVMECGLGEGREGKGREGKSGASRANRARPCSAGEPVRGATLYSKQSRQAQVGYDLGLRRSPGAQTVPPGHKLLRPAELWPCQTQERREPRRPGRPQIPRG